MEKNIKTDIKKLIFDKIEILQRSEKTLKKFFPFTMEDLNDDPEGCIEVIEDYLEQHSDKIIDFEFDTWIDESAMIPVIMLKMKLVPSISSHLMSIRSLNNLLPSSVEVEIIQEEISEIFFRYSYELNDKKTREEIMNAIKYHFYLDKIEDRTTVEDIDNQTFNFVIIKDGKEINLKDYPNYIASKKRFEE